VKTPIALAALVAAASLASTARATTEPAVLMHVKVALTSSKISLSRTASPRGYEVEFSVRNRTGAKRIFSVAGKAIVVPARALRLTAVSFQARGRFRVVSRTISRTGRSRVTTIYRVQ
jgi:hypothetical protein